MMGAGAIRNSTHRGHYGKHQPAYRTSELAYVLGQSGVSVLISALTFQRQRL